ncbi:MAG: dephospho-CoA kinase [Candidatus Omnitrophica bacterium]|nr:dephospho-CoA kinase [Candidatus Omnitrophota bacterium]
MIYVVGVTGGICSGKTSVARMMAEKGALVMDADVVAHELMQPGESVFEEVKDWLGDEVLTAGGQIDRKKVARAVFEDPDAVERLNGIVHPAVIKRILEDIERLRSGQEARVVVLDVPLLIEANMVDLVDLLVVVRADEAVQIKRSQERMGLSPEETQQRMRYQLPMEEKERLADCVIENSGNLDETKRQVDKIWNEMIVANLEIRRAG